MSLPESTAVVSFSIASVLVELWQHQLPHSLEKTVMASGDALRRFKTHGAVVTLLKSFCRSLDGYTSAVAMSSGLTKRFTCF